MVIVFTGRRRDNSTAGAPPGPRLAGRRGAARGL